MSTRPTLNDFEKLLHRLTEQALDRLGRASAGIAAEAARTGAASGNRIVFVYADALEEHWRAVASEAIVELRRWTDTSAVDRIALRRAAEGELRALIPRMVAASKVDKARKKFANQAMLKNVVDRVGGIAGDLDYRLRQFDIDMDKPIEPKEKGWSKMIVLWVGKNIGEITLAVIIAVLAAIILAALGMS